MKCNLKFLSALGIALIFCSLYFIKNNFIVSASDELITVGTLQVNSDTKISEIENVLGKAKLKTISPFGGYAYTFYTDDNYDNYLYIETTSDDKIISYGSVDDSYSVLGDKNNGSSYEKDDTPLSGYFYTDNDNKIVGGVYYNPSAFKNGSADDTLNMYNENYDKAKVEYQTGINKHAVYMFNALARRLGKNINLKYDDYTTTLVFGYNNNSSYYSFKNAIKSSKNFNEQSNELGVQTEVYFSQFRSSVINPMYFASLIKNNEDKDYNDKDIAIFNFDATTQELYGYTVSKKWLDEFYYSYNYSSNYYYNTNNDKSIFYIVNQLDDKMSETEKALVIAQYVQEGYAKGSSTSYIGNNSYFKDLANTVGLSCELLASSKTQNDFNICNLDNEWTYIDVTKPDVPSYDATPYQQIKFKLLFKGRETIEKDMADQYDIEGAKEQGGQYDYLFSPASYPKGVDKKVEDYESRVYYDGDYKYYERTIDGVTKLYKENRNNGNKEELTEVLKQSGLVKDGNILYYVKKDNSLYSLDLTSNDEKQIATSEDGKKLSGVYLQKDGYIYYTLHQNEKTEAIKLKELSVWPVKKIYLPSDNTYKYRFDYYETPTSVSIYDVVGFGNSTAGGVLYIPDEIDEKPVVGFGVSRYAKENFSGEFKTPKNLIYINSIIGNNEFTSLEFNNKLKSIGNQTFYNSNTIKGTLTIPDSVTYIGREAFYGCSGISELKLGNGLHYINHYLFYNVNLGEKFVMPEGIEYIGLHAFGYPNNRSKAVFLPESLKSIKQIPSYEELFIKSKNIEYMDNRYGDIYLPKDSKTSKYADDNDIEYYPVEDFNNLKQTVLINSYDIGGKTWYRDMGDETLDVGEYLSVRPKYFYDDETVFTWTSSDTDVATVDGNGLVTFVNPGTTEIKVTTQHGGENFLNLIVKGVNLNYNTWQFKSLNEKLTLKATLNGKAVEVSWYSSDNDIATVDQKGNVTPKRGGFVTISAYSDDGGTSKCLIYISVPIELSDGSKAYAGDLNKDGVIDDEDISLLESYVEKSSVSDDELLLGDIDGNGYISENDLNKLKSIKEKNTFKVGTYTHIDKVSLDKDNMSLPVKSSGKLKATITPENTTDSKTLTWESSNNKVATVDNNGNITTKKDGITTITVTTVNGKTAKCKLIVGIGEAAYKKGDMNEDDIIDITDAREILYFVVGRKKVTEEVKVKGDMNKNGKIEADDASNILRIYLSKS